MWIRKWSPFPLGPHYSFISTFLGYFYQFSLFGKLCSDNWCYRCRRYVGYCCTNCSWCEICCKLQLQKHWNTKSNVVDLWRCENSFPCWLKLSKLGGKNFRILHIIISIYPSIYLTTYRSLPIHTFYTYYINIHYIVMLRSH